MNTTYDHKFRLNALTTTMEDTLYRWSKVEPSLSQISNAVKGWQLDVKNMMNSDEYNIPATKNAELALQEAWHHRDNRNLALKAANDAKVELKAAIKAVQDVKDDFVPAYVKKTMAYAMKSATPVAAPEHESLVQVNAWVKQAREQLNEIEMVPQNNHQYLAYNANLEGQIYRDTAARAKSWLGETANDVYAELTEESKNAIKSVDSILNVITGLSQPGQMNRQDREEIFINVRKAQKALDSVKLAPRTPTIKADLMNDVERVRGSIDHVMPMLESGAYDESDLFRDVMVSVNEVRRLGNALPYKSLPQDTMDNIFRADKALGIVLTDKRASIRIKALQAAAANIDLIASDLAAASNGQSGVAAKSFS